MTNQFVGKAERQKNKWIITAQPHVMIKLKQIFSGIDKSDIGKVQLSDTPANCAELLWFCQRYPLDVVQRSYMAMQAALQHEREATMAKVLAPDYVPPANTAMALPPRHYQLVGAEFAYHAGGSLNGDDLGVGKAQPLDAKVLTPNGWRRMGDLAVGDALVGSSGQSIRVIGVFEQGMRAVWRIKTKDYVTKELRTTTCCEEHLWTANVLGTMHETLLQTEDLRALINHGRHVRLPYLDNNSKSWAQIVSIEPAGEEPCRCIMVDAPDHLYVTDDFIITHNTVTAITLFSRRECLPVVVVAQTQICKQWERQINKFLPGVIVHVAREGKPYDVTLSHYDRSKRKWIHTEREPDVIVLNYHKLSGWAQWIIEQKRAHTLIFDECQELRHHGTAKYAAAKVVRESARWCLALSATPTVNLGGEIWAVVDVIRPGALGTREEFGREWCTVAGSTDDGPKYAVKDPDALGTHLRASGIMLRRTRKEIGNELPPLQRVIQVVDTDNEALAEVSASAVELAKTILSTTSAGLHKMKASRELDWRLRQATGLAKAPHVAHFVRMIVEQGEPVILTGWHRAVYEMWLRLFTDEKLGDLKPVFITGEESDKQKDDAVQKFRNGETNLLILSLRSGAGIDGLQDRCNIIVHGELDWSPKIMDQVDGRAHRDGQKRSVTAYYLVSEDGSDPVIMDVLGIKEAQCEGIRNPGAEVAKPLGQTDPAHVRKLAEAYLRKHAERQTTT